ncbi:MAG: beta-propeller fold lactonase family protein [Ignavibacteria bacterium]
MINRIKKLLFSIIFIIILYFSVIYLQSCKQDFANNPEGSTEFPDEISAIFNTPYTVGQNTFTCSTPSCHASGNNANGMDLVDWQNALNGSNNGTMIIPYNGYWSHIIAYLNKDTSDGMPPVAYIDPSSLFYDMHKIDPAKITTIMNWINDGAKSKDGQIAFTTVPNSDKAFITNQAADLVAVVQPEAKRVVRLIPVGGRTQLDAPHYIELSPDNNYFYISLIQEGYIEKYDANTYAQVGRMAAGQSPAHIIISPDGHTGYVTNFESSGSVTTTTKFNADNMTITDIFTEPRMKGPHGMALTNDGSVLYVTSEIGEYIFKINTATFYNSDTTYTKSPLDPSVPPSGNGTGNFRPYQVLLSPDETLLYVSLRGANQVRIYNASDLSQINSIALGDNSFPLLMKITDNGQYLFVCNRNNNSVSVINCQTQTIASTIPDVGIQPHGVDFTTDGQYAIIACETQSGFDGHHPTVGSTKPGTTRLIQISNLSLLPDRIEMASFPAGIAIVK